MRGRERENDRKVGASKQCDGADGMETSQDVLRPRGLTQLERVESRKAK